MSDEKTTKGRETRNQINVNNKDEVAYWSKLFGVSEQELRAAVERVGPYIEDIAQDLGRKLRNR
jgi:hypothetical protein